MSSLIGKKLNQLWNKLFWKNIYIICFFSHPINHIEYEIKIGKKKKKPDIGVCQKYTRVLTTPRLWESHYIPLIIIAWLWNYRPCDLSLFFSSFSKNVSANSFRVCACKDIN